MNFNFIFTILSLVFDHLIQFLLLHQFRISAFIP